jgi:hypothetical protein
MPKKDPRQEAGESIARELGRQLAKELEDTTTGPKMGFALWIFDFNRDNSKEAFLSYVSNARREDMIRMLREHLARLERDTN